MKGMYYDAFVDLLIFKGVLTAVEAHIYTSLADASPYTTNAAHSLTVHPSRRIEIIAT